MAPNVTVDGHALWITLKIKNSLHNESIRIQNANVARGKFYRGNPNNEVLASGINRIVIDAGTTGIVSACGRQEFPAPVGTEGSIDIFGPSTRICTIYWSCPKVNLFEVWDGDRSFVVNVVPRGRPPAIGEVHVDVRRAKERAFAYGV